MSLNHRGAQCYFSAAASSGADADADGLKLLLIDGLRHVADELNIDAAAIPRFQRQIKPAQTSPGIVSRRTTLVESA